MREQINAGTRGIISAPLPELALHGARSWTGPYLYNTMVIDGCAALGAGLIALAARFSEHHAPAFYLTFTLGLPVIWVMSVALARGYQARLIGIGADEFRRVGVEKK